MKTPPLPQYKMVCSVCKTEYTSFSTEGFRCSRCNGDVLFTGFTIDDYSKKSDEEKKDIIQKTCGVFSGDSEISDTTDNFRNRFSGQNAMLMTTTPVLQGYKIKRYLGIVSIARSMQVTTGGGVINAIAQQMDKYGLDSMRQTTLQNLQKKAWEMGANAIVGVSIDIVPMDAHAKALVMESSFVYCNAYGTAVFIEPESPQSAGAD